MRYVFAILFVVVAVGMVGFFAEERQVMAEEVSSKAKAAADKSAPLAHIVFFTLAEANDENRAKLVAGCKKFLDGHEGVEYFSVGVRAAEYDRPVNDRDYDVALHLVFKTAADQDAYQTHPRHVQFVEECQGLWKQVRVFDSRLQ
jgi:hypothetical protein